mmetsp:Transcript_27075/g.37694  ORF Transcript_27075/g.37694 Transcript_27075/m.37694 type:complete len:377 (+) Transcript_27075:191-1321(+)|eukprot:CAMPEP_0184478992 /NCGR_PEP_ID=MMETSP0113_2-20130426/872_1 /TAXON_ID=91329 /ORGANISM="Norrisiella sphaerica, Strain BC52" /LENGTH=376 /DNA_ID=CAMNT_0026856967 /DNA_START=162 /DNA_END=1292 /DNA_ORIENTATION=+
MERCPVWKVDSKSENWKHLLKEAVGLLKAGEVIGFPTETVYGLGGNAFSDTAIQKIFSAKGRPSNNPLIVHVSSEKQMLTLVDQVPPVASKLIKSFWPGPLTLVLPTKKGSANKVSKLVTCGMKTVAVRMPSHPVALELIAASGLPIAAPSANKSGKPSPTAASHVMEDLCFRIAGVVDGGKTGIGLESTVVDCSEAANHAVENSNRKYDQKIVILRPGGVTLSMLAKVVGRDNVFVDPALDGSGKAGIEETKLKPKSPGMLYTHYAPDAPFALVDGSREFLTQVVEKARAAGKRVGLLTTEDLKDIPAEHHEIFAKDLNDIKAASKNLYGALRAFNDTNVDIIYAPLMGDQGIGAALFNRMMKASGRTVISEPRK